ncbi:conserved Plasmodium protein, unknown function [Plasmodium sp. gorilla clade G1]|nr:conserved Plasmodium protein, unknown function [Plasmodium sp. gorilla clade G1]
MASDMEEKFREAFILFSSCSDHIEMHKFFELMNSFGIILTNDEKAALPNDINMDYWLNFAKEHYNYEQPFKHINNVNEQNTNVQIKIDNFLGIMKALDTRLTESDLNILLQITNPENKSTLNLKTVSQKLTESI